MWVLWWRPGTPRPPQLCPLLPAGTTQRTLPGAPCATAVTLAVPLVTPSPESCQVPGLGCGGPTHGFGVLGGGGGGGREAGTGSIGHVLLQRSWERGHSTGRWSDRCWCRRRRCHGMKVSRHPQPSPRGPQMPKQPLNPLFCFGVLFFLCHPQHHASQWRSSCWLGWPWWAAPWWQLPWWGLCWGWPWLPGAWAGAGGDGSGQGSDVPSTPSCRAWWGPWAPRSWRKGVRWVQTTAAWCRAWCELVTPFLPNKRWFFYSLKLLLVVLAGCHHGLRLCHHI